LYRPNGDMVMTRLSLVLVVVLASVTATRGAEPGEDPAGVKRAKEFWSALAKGDPAAMKDFYAKEVTLLPGSELLKEEWGIRGAGDRNKALLVSRDELIAAYQRMIDKAGRDKWAAVFGKVPAEKVEVTIAVTKAQGAALKTIAGDIVLKVQATKKDDSLFYVLRPSATGGWQVVAELADY
jgi:hypothetical protein